MMCADDCENSLDNCQNRCQNRLNDMQYYMNECQDNLSDIIDEFSEQLRGQYNSLVDCLGYASTLEDAQYCL